MNRCTLSKWYFQPVHCPFCGEALAPDEGLSCKHLLYIISAGNFVSRSDRFDQALGLALGDGDFWPEFGIEDKSKFGDPHVAACKVLETLPAHLEFQIDGPTDSVLIGFAALDEELCGFGKDHKSPYGADF